MMNVTQPAQTDLMQSFFTDPLPRPRSCAMLKCRDYAMEDSTMPSKHTQERLVVVSGAIETESGILIARMDREPGNGTTPVERDDTAERMVLAYNNLNEKEVVMGQMGQMPSIDKIMAYEQGEMDEQEMIEFFQDGVTNEWVWHLQGSYGRAAMRLLESGSIHR